MTFARCFFHCYWTTKHRTPVITPPVESVILESIRKKTRDLGCILLAANTVSDHVHVAVSIPPRLAPAEYLQHIKGLSTREINQMLPNLETAFAWQQGYGILTFSAGGVEFVTKYVRNQKQHHADNSIIDYMETDIDTAR
jgi:REP element-mobilizing transposase RayT